MPGGNIAAANKVIETYTEIIREGYERCHIRLALAGNVIIERAEKHRLLPRPLNMSRASAC